MRRTGDRRGRAARHAAAMLCSLAFGAMSPAFALNGTGVRTADPLTWPVPTPAEAAAREQAGEAFVRDLVAALRARPEPRFQLAAAVLLVQSTRDGRAEGEALFARIRAGSDDPAVLHVAAGRCPFEATVCDADGALDALLARDPRDAEAIFRALDRAQRRGDTDGFDTWLAMLPAARFGEGGMLAANRAWTEVYALLRDDPRLPMIAGSLAVDARPLPPDLAIGVAALGRALAVPFVGRDALSSGCVAALEAPALVHRLQDCRRAAVWLREHGETRSDPYVGIRLGWRLAIDDTERADLERQWREHQWLGRGTSLDGTPAQPPGGLEGWRRQAVRYHVLLLEQPSESAALAIFRAEHGIGETPPADYRPTYTLAELDALRTAAQHHPAGSHAPPR